MALLVLLARLVKDVLAPVDDLLVPVVTRRVEQFDELGLAAAAARALIECEGVLEEYAARVYAEEGEFPSHTEEFGRS
ncbi:MAG TPA: hypothetical protein VMU75_03465 [Acidimicrobiales bacterium]|nr:hypothetical protein [Acidimicrobiales bacterium]